MLLFLSGVTAGSDMLRSSFRCGTDDRSGPLGCGGLDSPRNEITGTGEDGVNWPPEDEVDDADELPLEFLERPRDERIGAAASGLFLNRLRTLLQSNVPFRLLLGF